MFPSSHASPSSSRPFPHSSGGALAEITTPAQKLRLQMHRLHMLRLQMHRLQTLVQALVQATDTGTEAAQTTVTDTDTQRAVGTFFIYWRSCWRACGFQRFSCWSLHSESQQRERLRMAGVETATGTPYCHTHKRELLLTQY